MNKKKILIAVLGVVFIIGVAVAAFVLLNKKTSVPVEKPAKENIKEYCLSPEFALVAGIGDRLNAMSDLIHYDIAFNKRNFAGKSDEHENLNSDFIFSELPDNNKGKKYIDYTYAVSPEGKEGVVYGNTFHRSWAYANEHADEIYKLLNIDKKKKEILKKYNVPSDYFDNSISLHIRCGDTKNKRVEPFEKYRNAVKYINQKTGANKVICFYENDDFSVKTATGIIDKLKKEFPNIKFEKCMHVDTDSEEFLMMSMCKHNIQSYSYFVKWATNFNTNPDKVIFKMHFDRWGDYNGNGFCDYDYKEK